LMELVSDFYWGVYRLVHLVSPLKKLESNVDSKENSIRSGYIV
jgi:hypothetical protein